MVESIHTPPQQAFFQPSVAGDILLTYFPTHIPGDLRRDVIFLPPFADEMNKARRMMALQARALAEIGVGTLFVDLYGTGDSQGDFKDARWEIWRDDIGVAMDWLRQQGCQSISLIGLRMGALLAMQLAQQDSTAIEKIVLWQPILSGENMMTQFLRLLTTASRMDSTKSKETASSLRTILGSGEAIEVAGYELTSKLAAALDNIKLAPLAGAQSPPLHWFELLLNPESPLPLTSRKIIEQWQAAQVKISVSPVVGQSFWDGKNITTLPELVLLTTEIFREKPGQ